MTYRFWAAKLGVQLDAVSVHAEGDLDVRGFFGLDPDARPGFGAVRLAVTLDGPESAERYRELRAAVDSHCPALDLFTNATPVSVDLNVGAPPDAPCAGTAAQVSPANGKGPSSRLRTMPPSDRVVMPHLMPSAFTRQVINPLVSKLHTGGVVTLTVTGRRSGQPRRVPVIPVTIDDKRYLVSPYGETDWARNLRTAGQGHLRGRGTAETFHAKEIPVQERAGVIAAYRKIAGRVVDSCFAALPDPADHPVFLIE